MPARLRVAPAALDAIPAALLAALAAVMSLAASAREACAGEPDTYGFGSRASALGGAVSADAADVSGNYYNPAAIVSAPGLTLTLGYTTQHNDLRIDDRDTGVAAVHGLTGGLVAPGKLAGIPFAFGVGAFLPDTGLSRIKALRQETPRWAVYDERASILFLASNLAIRPVLWLEIGGGVAFLATTRGKFAISGTADALHPYDSQLRHEVDADLTTVRYPQAGARIKLPSFGYLGLVYRGESKLKLSLDAHLSGSVNFAGIDVPLRYDLASRTTSAFLPQQVVAGLSYQDAPGLRIDFDLTFVNWAAYESPTAETKAHLAVDLPKGLPIALPPDPKPTAVMPPAFENRFVPRIGIEYLVYTWGAPRVVRGHAEPRPVLEIPLRFGYVYERSPVPPQTGVLNFVDADRHTFSLGVAVTLNALSAVFPGSMHLDVHGQLSVLPTRVTRKTNPADFIGDYRAGGAMQGVGTTLTAVF
jgi:long-chain fatty acid transport protein